MSDGRTFGIRAPKRYLRIVVTWGEPDPKPTDVPVQETETDSVTAEASEQQPLESPSLDAAYARHARAKEHIDHVAEEVARYVENFNVPPEKARLEYGKPYAMQGFDSWQIERPRPILSVRLGEAIYNLRAALDYLIYELAWLDSGKIQTRTQFPIESDADVFEGRVSGTYVQRRSGKKPKKRSCDAYLVGVNTKHVGWIRHLQPCHGCKWTKLLQDLSNPDKHRSLLEVARGFQFRHQPLGPPVQTETGLVMDVEAEYAPFISVNGIALDQALAELHEEVGNVLALFKPEF